MPHRVVTLLDEDRMPIATADVDDKQGRCSGTVDVNHMPESLRRLFEEYEEIVSNQIFGLLDQIEDRINSIPLLVVFDDGVEARARDVQIFPRSGTISFEVAESGVPNRSR